MIGRADANAPAANANDLPRLYYLTTPAGLTLSPSRKLIERAIERQLVGAANLLTSTASDIDQAAPDSESRAQTTLQTTGKGVDLMTKASYRGNLRKTNRLAWSNIPILNYLRRQYPDRDPVETFRLLWGETLVEPSGDSYVWNEDRGTYVSTLHGYHLEPRPGPGISHSLGPNDRIKTTLSFQDGGLRGTLAIDKH